MDPGRRERPHPQPAAREPGQLRQLVPRLVQFVQYPPGPARQQLARRRQPRPAMVAYQQCRPRLPLQLGQLLRERRGGVAEARAAARVIDPASATATSAASRVGSYMKAFL